MRVALYTLTIVPKVKAGLNYTMGTLYINGHTFPLSLILSQSITTEE